MREAALHYRAQRTPHSAQRLTEDERVRDRRASRAMVKNIDDRLGRVHAARGGGDGPVNGQSSDPSAHVG
jgi:hypothetical protein